MINQRKYSRKYIGQEFKSKDSLGGYTFRVIDGGTKVGYALCEIVEEPRFNASEFRICHLKDGAMENSYRATVCDIGYIGQGKHIKSVRGKDTKQYKVWWHMIHRVYSKKYPTYKKVKVCEEWHNFQVFAEWFEKQKESGLYQDGWQLDKDLFSDRENKIYSPSTCVFLPPRVNSFFTNKKISNTSGYIGVSYNKGYKKYQSQISFLYEETQKTKYKHLGFFDTKKEALNVYKEARKLEVKKLIDIYKDILADKIINRIEDIEGV